MEDMTRAVYEAMTNAVEHAYPPERVGPDALTASCAGEMLEVVICDQGVWHDPPADSGSRGRGLQLIGLLAGHAEIRPRTQGTTARCAGASAQRRGPPTTFKGAGHDRSLPW